MIIDFKEVKNAYGQSTVTGKIVLRKDVEMRNSANDGCCVLGTVIQPALITVPVGTEVEFRADETRTGWYQGVTVRNKKGIFYNSVCTETFQGRKYK